MMLQNMEIRSQASNLSLKPAVPDVQKFPHLHSTIS